MTSTLNKLDSANSLPSALVSHRLIFQNVTFLYDQFNGLLALSMLKLHLGVLTDEIDKHIGYTRKMEIINSNYVNPSFSRLYKLVYLFC